MALIGWPWTASRSLGWGLAGSCAMTILVDDLVPDGLWAMVEPLLPAPPRPPYDTRRPVVCRPRAAARRAGLEVVEKLLTSI
jgi:hypothetical protein